MLTAACDSILYSLVSFLNKTPILEGMEGLISSFRRGRCTQTPNQMIVKPSGVDKKEDAVKLIGKAVSWKSPAGKEIKGKVTKEHGRNGSVRVLFETGMPGQSLGSKVSIQ